MTSTVGGGHEAIDIDVEALAGELSRSSIHDPVGHLLVRLDDAQGYDRLPQPTLPPEVLERVVRHIQPDVLVGDPVAYITLVRLSCVSRLMRHWALEALYSIIILPRHVREFRKWYSRSVKSQPAFQFAGYSRALFSGLDDVSRLTSFSAGWDHELLRLLHYCGPTLTHLSLWRSESMALLRDPGQVREGYRFGTSSAPCSGSCGRPVQQRGARRHARLAPGRNQAAGYSSRHDPAQGASDAHAPHHAPATGLPADASQHHDELAVAGARRPESIPEDAHLAPGAGARRAHLHSRPHAQDFAAARESARVSNYVG
ncbi:hypothetical protein L1887_58378 [Cichorium endivia]|nr:hypothetical protein L1887_58378 [Cichorium endivia]